MIGSGYWSIGITVAWTYAGGGDYGWRASLSFLDDGFCSDDADQGVVSTEGKLQTRYAVREGDTADALTVVIDTLIADAQRLGILLAQPGGGTAALYYEGDGENDEFPPPDGWRELLGQHADRLGWRRLYGSASPQSVPTR